MRPAAAHASRHSVVPGPAMAYDG